MAARESSRVTAVLGPTNTGKTHLAVERLCAHSSGIMGFPLRLLAREVYDRVVAIKGAAEVGLVTGEEKIMPPGARWILATVESMPLDRDVAFLAIDEAQLAGDPERGHIFTNRILHARGRDETMILGSDSLRPIIRALLPDADIISRPRFSSLSYAGSKKLTRLPPRSAIIGFSADEVYTAAELIRRTHGGAAIVMGGLSPKTRNAQVAMFQAGEVDYLVATDAIGMGLNMDLGHVAFSSLSKFDGRKRRRLAVSELAQIAGRAGRHQRDGSFGTLASTAGGGLTDDEVRRIEDHHFPALNHLQWRNADLDYGTPLALLNSLAFPSSTFRLRLSQKSTDEEVLATLSTDPAISGRSWSPALTSRLWSVCRLPDFMKRGSSFHATIVARLWSHIGTANGHIPADWIAAELSRLDNVQGDIDAMTTRIAASRTWAFAAHQKDWLEDPLHWSERAVALEHKLSDALHRKLTERFVDRRTSMLVRSKSSSGDMLSTAINHDGTVLVEDEAIGTLRGFLFQTLPHANFAETKALQAAADRQLIRELQKRASELSLSAHADFSLSFGANGPVALKWRNADVASLARGPSPLRPKIKLRPEIMKLAIEVRHMIEARLSLWMQQEVRQKLKKLVELSEEMGCAASPAAVRAVAVGLIEGLGVCSRASLSASISNLTPVDRQLLKHKGVVIGSLDVFVPSLLRPQVEDLRNALAGTSRNLPSLPSPRSNNGMVVSASPDKMIAAKILGYRTHGSVLLRADILEKIAQEWHKSRNGREAFAPNSETARRLGLPDEITSGLLRKMGFRQAHNGQSGQWLWRGLQRVRQTEPNRQNAFSQLKSLQFAP